MCSATVDEILQQDNVTAIRRALDRTNPALTTLLPSPFVGFTLFLAGNQALTDAKSAASKPLDLADTPPTMCNKAVFQVHSVTSAWMRTLNSVVSCEAWHKAEKERFVRRQRKGGSAADSEWPGHGESGQLLAIQHAGTAVQHGSAAPEGEGPHAAVSCGELFPV